MGMDRRCARMLLVPSFFALRIATAAPADASPLPAEYRQAVQAQQNGDFRTAVQSYTAALLLAPSRAEIWYGRGVAYQKLAETGSTNATVLRDSALVDLTRAIELDSTNATVWNARAVVKLSKGSAAEAVDDFSRALAINPRFSDALRGRAAAFQVLGRIDEALGDLTTAISHAPYEYALYSTRAELYRIKGLWLQAANDYSRILEIVAGPYSPQAEKTRGHAFRGRGDCWLEQGELAKALTDHEAAVAALGNESRTEIASVWAQRAATLTRRGKADSAVILFATALRFQPAFFTAYAGRARAYFAKGRYQDAIADLDTFLTHNPESYHDLLLRGQCREKLGLIDSATADYRRALQAAQKASDATDSLVRVIWRHLGKH